MASARDFSWEDFPPLEPALEGPNGEIAAFLEPSNPATGEGDVIFDDILNGQQLVDLNEPAIEEATPSQQPTRPSVNATGVDLDNFLNGSFSPLRSDPTICAPHSTTLPTSDLFALRTTPPCEAPVVVTPISLGLFTPVPQRPSPKWLLAESFDPPQQYQQAEQPSAALEPVVLPDSVPNLDWAAFCESSPHAEDECTQSDTACLAAAADPHHVQIGTKSPPQDLQNPSHTHKPSAPNLSQLSASTSVPKQSRAPIPRPKRVRSNGEEVDELSEFGREKKKRKLDDTQKSSATDPKPLKPESPQFKESKVVSNKVSTCPSKLKRRRSDHEEEDDDEFMPGHQKKKAKLKVAQFELPKFHPAKPWIKINTLTKGLTKRSQKISAFEPERVYEKLPNKFHAWTSSNRHRFTYTHHGELDKPHYKIEAIKDFIYEHPRGENSKLTLWIQRSPADSARRYPLVHSNKCRFRSCPMLREGYQGSITHGHYRVTFDERWRSYKDRADPMVVAGYVHLYCLERFLNLPEICTLEHITVRVDERTMPKEPDGHWKAALQSVDGYIGRNFIAAIRHGKFNEKYPQYPAHNGRYESEPKPDHDHTLNAMMQRARNSKRKGNGSANKGKPSRLENTLGDLEEFLKHRGNKSRIAKARIGQLATLSAEESDPPCSNDAGSVHSPPTKVAECENSSSTSLRYKTSDDSDYDLLISPRTVLPPEAFRRPAA